MAMRDEAFDGARELARKALDDSRGTHPEQALALCQEAVALLMPFGLSETLADALRWQGTIERELGNLADAQALYRQSLSVSRSLSYFAGHAHALNCLGSIAQLKGQFDDAIELYGHAGRIANDIGEVRLWALTQQNLGIIAEDEGRTDDASMHFRLALAALSDKSDSDGAVVWLLNNLGLLYAREGLPHRAASALDRARTMAVAHADLESEGVVEENRARVHAMLGDLEAAGAAATRAYVIAELRHDLIRRAAALRALAVVRHRQSSDSAVVAGFLETALTFVDTGHDALLQSEILLDLGDVYSDSTEFDRALACWNRGLAVAQRAGIHSLIEAHSARLRSQPVPNL